MSLNAILYDQSLFAEPLLGNKMDDQELQHAQSQIKDDPNLLDSFKSISLLIGMTVGFFIQCSTIGANSIIITLWGSDIVNKTRTDIIIYSLCWALFTSFLTMAIMLSLRHIISVAYNTIQTSDTKLQALILHMECRFVIGAFFGVCLSWGITDTLLGKDIQYVYAIVTFLVCIGYYIMLVTKVLNDEDDDEDDDDEEINRDKKKTTSGPYIVML